MKVGTRKRPSSKRYMVGQKLSDYQMQKILLAFAEGKLAKEVKDRSPRTVGYIFNLLRKRLVDVGYVRAGAKVHHGSGVVVSSAGGVKMLRH